MAMIFFLCWTVWALQSTGPIGFLKHLFAPKGDTTGLLKMLMVVVFLAGDRTAVDFAEDTPEGALQRYLRAFDDGDLDAAYAYFSADVRADMDRDAYERTVAMYHPGIGVDRTRRALFDSSR